jgi:cysteine-rich repeat protein
LICDALPCSAPPGISNGAAGTPTGLVAGSTVSYSCTTAGYVLSGGATATCNDTGGSSGAWQNVPSCAPVDCNSPSTGLVPNATRGTVGTTTLNSTVIYTCASNFNTTGSPGGSTSVTATCGTAGAWTPNVAQCVPISCGAPPAAPNASVSGSAVNAPSSVTYTCTAGFSANGVYNGSRTFTNTCGSGGWSAPSPAGCARYTCLPFTPTTGVGIAYSPAARLWAGDSAALSCLGGYYTASTTGSNLTCASSTGTYGTSSFSCDQVLCPALGAPANGNAVSYNQGAVGGQYPVGTTASFGCTTGYSLSSSTTRVCTQVLGSAVGSWSNTSPVCNNINDCTAGRCTGTGNTCVDLVNGYRCECSTASGYNANTSTYTNPTNGSVTCTPDCGDGRLIAGEPCDASVAGQPGNNVVPLCEQPSCTYCQDSGGVCSIASVGPNACNNNVNDDGGPAPDQGTDCFDRDCSNVQGCPAWNCGSAMTEYIAGATGNVSRSVAGRVNDNTGWVKEDYGFAWRADFNGQVTMQTCGSGFDTTLSVWNGAVCSYSSSTGSIAYNDDTASCAGGSNGGYGSRVTFNVTNGSLYTVLVDGFSGAYLNDNFTLNIASSCGNGTQQTNEACDDGNRNNGDGCSSACIVESGWECFGFGLNTCGQLRFDYTLQINQNFSYSNTPKDYYIGVSNCGTVIRMESILDLYHQCRDDVEIDFYNPAGTEWGAKGTGYVFLCNRPWSDPTYTTNTEFRGTNGNGTWRFRLDDDYANDDGTIYSWRLRLWCR